ncbi:hypothetical protein H6F42_11395 [Pseudanabaena sp. FACHB-1998]|uniref:hypothetical protein n=1 Tax=Pseudanabaena sp. FACHB-1998 TaxID=2692858 RepID=UPI0016811748|nr:hypothetical protein [Pseudanabaena sp. FACHB-1998]MBD2177517.1 hypothetical protein [Pseudanabaena sp. FACHB-1998]
MKNLFSRLLGLRLPKLLMPKVLRQVFRRSPKTYRRQGLAFGFTLLELLIASLIAAALVTTLLGFLVGVLDSDRKETAKSNAQEELQAAINYIADDLQEAIYIYGSEGIYGTDETGSAANKTAKDGIFRQLPHAQQGTTNNENECFRSTETATTCTPILVFWKRYTYDPLSTGTYSKPSVSPSTELIGCMPYIDIAAQTSPVVPAQPLLTNCKSTSTATNPYLTPYGGNRYVYSLVAYYLKNDTSLVSNTWSKTARILRWELKDGYTWFCGAGGTISDASKCPTDKATTRRPNATSPFIISSTVTVPPVPPSTTSSTTNIFLTDTTNYFISPDPGFNRIDFAGAGTLTSLAKIWQQFDNYNFTQSPFVTLVDFMDDTAYTAAQGGNSTAAGTGSTAVASAGISIPVGKNVAANTITGVTSPSNPDCDDASVGVGNSNPASSTTTSGVITQRIPPDFASPTVNPSRLSSFYACVAPERTSVRIFLRGNALARLSIPFNDRQPKQSNISFFPTADVRSFGRSSVGIKSN